MEVRRWISEHSTATVALVLGLLILLILIPMLGFDKVGSAQYLGAVVGSMIGLIALLVGALFNADLERSREREKEKREAIVGVITIAAEARRNAHVLEVIGRGLEIDNQWKGTDNEVKYLISSLSTEAFRQHTTAYAAAIVLSEASFNYKNINKYTNSIHSVRQALDAYFLRADNPSLGSSRLYAKAIDAADARRDTLAALEQFEGLRKALSPVHEAN